jgi:hypothetical protein
MLFTPFYISKMTFETFGMKVIPLGFAVAIIEAERYGAFLALAFVATSTNYLRLCSHSN